MEKELYTTVKGYTEKEIDKIKGSRFIGRLYRISGRDEAELLLDAARKKYYDATHNCFAYAAGTGDSRITRSSDDGEPSGTAGRPILAVLEGSGVTDALLVVTRYYGGTNLGTGGLIKAYTEAAKAVIGSAEKETVEIFDCAEFSYKYEITSTVMNLIKKYEASISSEKFGQEGPCIRIKINRAFSPEFIKEIFEKSNGSVKAEIC